MPELENEPILDEPVETTEETQEATATEVPEVDETETASGSDPDKPESKGKGSGVDKRFAKLTRQKYELLETNSQLLERLNRIEQRLSESPANSKADAKPQGEPQLDDYQKEPDPWTAYYKAMAKWEAAKLIEENRQAAEKQENEEYQKEIFDSYEERLNDFRSTHDDFDEVIGGKDSFVPVSGQLAIVELENGPEVAYYLGQHPEICKKIWDMRRSTVKVQREITRISDSLSSQGNSPEKRPVTGAPAPVKPVGTSSTKSSVPLEKMSQKEYNRVMDERERKRREG